MHYSTFFWHKILYINCLSFKKWNYLFLTDMNYEQLKVQSTCARKPSQQSRCLLLQVNWILIILGGNRRKSKYNIIFAYIWRTKQKNMYFFCQNTYIVIPDIRFFGLSCSRRGSRTKPRDIFALNVQTWLNLIIWDIFKIFMWWSRITVSYLM